MTSYIYQFVNKYKWSLPALNGLITLAALALTLLPVDQVTQTRLFDYDKIGHALMFGSWTFVFGLMRINSQNRSVSLYPVFIAGCSFGLAIELLQWFLPIHRSGDWFDFMADVVGCMVAIGILKLLIKSWKRERIIY